MNRIKRMICIVLICSLSCLNVKTIYAAEYKKISVGKDVKGSIDSSKDVKWYKFSFDEKGVFWVYFNHASLDEIKNGWKLTIYDQDKKPIYVAENLTFSVNSSTQVGVTKGTYYIKIEPVLDKKKKTKLSKVPYKIKVQYMEKDNWESEKNNSFKTADKITLDEDNLGVMNATLGMQTDKDYFVVANPLDELKVYIGTPVQDKNRFNVKIYNSKQKLVYEFNNTDGNTERSFTAPKGKYYIVVSSCEVNKYFNGTYELKVNAQ